MALTWIKSVKDDWLLFETFPNLADIKTNGVYIIWHGGQTPRVVYVGQGIICDRLTSHRSDQRIIKYKASGTLFVTWAAALTTEQDGIERYLADRLSPLVGDRHPDAKPIPVNLPWAA